MRVRTNAKKRIRYSGTSRKMYPATTALRIPIVRNTCGIVSPIEISTPTISALAIMKSAFRMLLAAMIRARWLGAECRNRVARRRRQAARGEVKVDREHAHADRAERHQADLDVAARQHFAQQRADADADREDDEEQRRDLPVALEH